MAVCLETMTVVDSIRAAMVDPVPVSVWRQLDCEHSLIRIRIPETEMWLCAGMDDSDVDSYVIYLPFRTQEFEYARGNEESFVIARAHLLKLIDYTTMEIDALMQEAIEADGPESLSSRPFIPAGSGLARATRVRRLSKRTVGQNPQEHGRQEHPTGIPEEQRRSDASHVPAPARAGIRLLT